MIRNKFIFLFLLMITVQLKAQQQFINIAPASPTVAELAKYAEIPVSYYTGIPEISIPLYVLTCGDLQVPITLNYYAGGIQVDQVATWVGLGWSLNAGGIVKRTVYDGKSGSLIDDTSCGPLESKNDVERSPYGGYSAITLKSMLGSETKLKPDLYSYNFLDFNGNMFYYFDRKKSFHDINNNKKISWDNFHKDLQAVDLKGVNYFFNKNDQELVRQDVKLYSYTNSLNSVGSKTSLSSSWNLSKIVSPNRTDSVLFQYVIQKEAYWNRINGYLRYYKSSNRWEGAYSNAPSFFKPLVNSNTQKLTEIHGSNGVTISFVADFVRKDLVSEIPNHSKTAPCALTQIIVKDVNGIQLKKWLFEYDHFYTSFGSTDEEENRYRLKLKSIKEFGNSNYNPRIYSFSYYGENLNEYKMPPRTNYSGHDYWGYCNGSCVMYSSSLFDIFPVIDQEFTERYQVQELMGDGYPINWEAERVNSSDTYNVRLRGVDKDANTSYVSAYSLKEITYPTGGKRIFEYESHDGICGGVRIKKIKNIFSDTDSVIKEYEYPYGPSIIDFPVAVKTKHEETATPQMDSYGFVHRTCVSRSSYLEVSSESYKPLYTISGEHYGYSDVNEKIPGGVIQYDYYSLHESRNEYDSYHIIKDDDDYLWRYERLYDQIEPFMWGFTGPNYRRGILAGKTYIDEEGRQLKQEVYHHTFSDTGSIPVWEVYYGMPGWSATKRFFNYNVTQHILGQATLDYKTVTYFNTEKLVNGNSTPELVTKEIYNYNSFNLLKSTETIDSNGDNRITEILYPMDINSLTYSDMCTKSMIDYPIEMTTKVNGQVVKSDLQTYANYSGNYLPSISYSFCGIDSLFCNYGNNGSVSKLYSPINSVMKRSQTGKVLAIRGEDQIDIVYVWGYNEQYPIAEIKNASYDDVISHLSEYKLNQISSKAIPDNTDWTLVNNLRASLPDAFITLYTYIPFVGVSSICGPDLRTVFYEYDSFGQLSRIYKKENGEDITIESYEYHYNTN